MTDENQRNNKEGNNPVRVRIEDLASGAIVGAGIGAGAMFYSFKIGAGIILGSLTTSAITYIQGRYGGEKIKC
ncbi:MAG: hypothetical protein KJ879_00975 [Nanoarchaeota archaeon]|nr:hypothetical protein [Nanoarchaeota archaeon]